MKFKTFQTRESGTEWHWVILMNDSFALVWYRFDIETLGLHVWVLKVISDDMTVCWFDIACWDSAGCVWVIFCALNYCMFSETSHCFDRFYRCETINIWKRTIVDPSWDGVKPQGHVTYTTGKADPRTITHAILVKPTRNREDIFNNYIIRYCFNCPWLCDTNRHHWFR